MESEDFFKNLLGLALFIGVVLAFFFGSKQYAKDCYSKDRSNEKLSVLGWAFLLGGIVGAAGGFSCDNNARGFALWVICFVAAWMGSDFGISEAKQKEK